MAKQKSKWKTSYWHVSYYIQKTPKQKLKQYRLILLRLNNLILKFFIFGKKNFFFFQTAQRFCNSTTNERVFRQNAKLGKVIINLREKPQN